MIDQVLNSSVDLNLQTPLLLLTIVVLEAILSADNAVALAAIAQTLKDDRLKRKALNIGLVFAYVLRIVLILTATWVIQFWQFEFLGAAYLLWLAFNYFTSVEDEFDGEHHHHLGFSSLWQVIPIIAVTDLAFSLDSVTTAIAVSTQIWIVVVGGTIGVITLRFLTGLFIRWLDEYTHLEDAGFLTVGFVGLRLLIKAIRPDLELPEWLMVTTVFLMFAWGFSKRNPETSNKSEE